MKFVNDNSQMLEHISEQVANAVRLVLKSNIIGIYLTGSAVLSDWHYGKSEQSKMHMSNTNINQSC